jgi:carbamoyltransferase
LKRGHETPLASHTPEICSVNTLGIATPGPGTSVALFDNHNILAAIEEEKLSRSNDPHALPQLALASVLASSGLRLPDIGVIALADRGAAARKNHGKNSEHQSMLAHLRQLFAGRRFSNFDHHLCHAAGAFYTSDFSRSLVLTLDHGANGSSGLVAVGEDDQIKSLQSLSFTN